MVILNPFKNEAKRITSLIFIKVCNKIEIAKMEGINNSNFFIFTFCNNKAIGMAKMALPNAEKERTVPINPSL